MIQINGTIKLASGSGQEIIDALIKMAHTSRAEDGCLDYTFARDLTDPDTLVLYERWRDRAALDAHFVSPHMAEFQKALAAGPGAERNIRLYETDDGQPL
ncbi:putative quinol monooxygenase [Erythrobacter sp.]|uniref:putative quinol monooxygenase n=1 Tax=Erythrobacter sp. TaxID=1042 RepID=UPI00311EE7F2